MKGLCSVMSTAFKTAEMCRKVTLTYPWIFYTTKAQTEMYLLYGQGSELNVCVVTGLGAELMDWQTPQKCVGNKTCVKWAYPHGTVRVSFSSK